MGGIEVDETIMGGKDQKIFWPENGRKRPTVNVIDKSGNGVIRTYGRVLVNIGSMALLSFIKELVHP